MSPAWASPPATRDPKYQPGTPPSLGRRYRVDGYPKRYNDLIEAYVPAQYAGIVRDPKGGAVGTQGPISNISSLRSGSEAYPLSGAVGGDPCTGPRAQVSSGRSPKPLASRSKPTSVRRRRRPSVRRRRPSVRRRPSSTVRRRRRRPSVSQRSISEIPILNQ